MNDKENKINEELNKFNIDPISKNILSHVRYPVIKGIPIQYFNKYKIIDYNSKEKIFDAELMDGKNIRFCMSLDKLYKVEIVNSKIIMSIYRIDFKDMDEKKTLDDIYRSDDDDPYYEGYTLDYDSLDRNKWCKKNNDDEGKYICKKEDMNNIKFISKTKLRTEFIFDKS